MSANILTALLLLHLFLGNLLPLRDRDDNTVLRVTPARVTAINENLALLLSAGPTATPTRVTGMSDGSSPQVDRSGHGRPGGSGTVMVEGIGLARATAIRFNGAGVSGAIQPIPSADLNPSIFVDIRIEAAAPFGPRHFTLTTPNGEVPSGDIVFIVEEPKVTSIVDQEGSPNASGLVSVSGVGLDGATDVTFSGAGVTAKLVGQRANSLINPRLLIDLSINSAAPLGERTVIVTTPRGLVGSGDVTFRVVSPRIISLFEGSVIGIEFKPSGEGTPGTEGTAFVSGIGLGGASSITFSGSGVIASLHDDAPASPAQQPGILNPAIQMVMRIASNTELGARTFTMDIPRGSGKVASIDSKVAFNVVRPRITSIRENEGVPGACGRVTITGVGLKDTSRIAFDPPLQVTGRITSASGDFLNPPIQAQLTIGQRAQAGGYSFTLNTPRDALRSGDILFIVTTPRITKMNTAGGFFTILDVPDAVAPGTSGMAAMQGIGLIGVTQVTFSGSGVTATVVPLPEGLSGLNPGVLLRITASDSATPGERSITLTMGGVARCGQARR